MAKLDKPGMDAALAALFVNNTNGDIEADEVLARFRDILDSYANTAALQDGDFPIMGPTNGVVTRSALSQGTELNATMPFSGPGNRTFDVGAISAASGGSTVRFLDRSRDLAFGAVIHETTSGAVASRKPFYFSPADDPTDTAAAADLSETFTGTTLQFMITNASLGTASEYRTITRLAGSAEISGCNLTIRRNSHTDPDPVFDYIRDVSGGAGFVLASGASVNNIQLGGEQLFLAGENLYITLTGDGSTPLNIRGQTLGGETIPHVVVRGHLGSIVFTEDALGNPTNDGQVLASTVAGVRSWVNLPSAAAPNLGSLSIDIASTVFTNTDLNTSHTVQYSISDAADFTDLTLVVTTGDDKTLTVPAFDGVHSETVTLSGIDTSSAGSVTFQLSGTHNSNTFTSNTVTVTIAAPSSTELVYIGAQASSDPATFDTGAATSSAFVAGRQTLTVPTFTGNQYLAYAQLGTEPDLTQIIIGGIDQLAAWTKTDSAITVSGQPYDVWITDNLIVGTVLSGQSVEFVR